jgi:hypothetical protein
MVQMNEAEWIMAEDMPEEQREESSEESSVVHNDEDAGK